MTRRRDGFDPGPAGPGEGVDEALGLVREIEEAVEGLPERAQAAGAAFLEDVLAKSQDVGETVRRTNRATDRQLAALKGWLAGVKRWDRRGD